jgi:hypothetical protein
MPSRHPTRSLRTLLVSVLLSLVFAQGLGTMHRALHAPRSAAAMLAGMAAPVHAGASVIEALFAGHDTGHACDQYDQLNHADLACGAHADFAAGGGLPRTRPARAGLRDRPRARLRRGLAIGGVTRR